MHIQCTKKLLDRLKLKAEPVTEENPIFSWHANLVTINRRQTLVLMNDKTRYIAVSYGLKAKDFSKINSVIVQALREVLLHEGIKEELVERYIQDAGEIKFTTTKDRNHVARLNMASRNTEAFADGQDMRDGTNEELSMNVSRLIVTDGNGGYISPNEELYRELIELYGEKIISTQAAEVKVTLMLEEHEVYRTLIVPLNRTFSEFHEILQTAFSWKDYHLHEFYILDQTTAGQETNWNHPAFTEEGYKPVLNLVSNEEAFDYPNDMEIRLEQGIKLSAFIPGCKVLIYHYDFGDSWRHKIEVKRVIDDFELNHPVCIGGVGDAPPEDVGGEGGFSQFLDVMANTDDPEYKYMKRWVIGQGYEAIDLEKINRMLEGR
ncbi:plasmid pRiA4b ORF-3 family protein [Ralstonia pickettii]|nr:plasmid pRiA4b ORF-3 family protein [Ralstonia pickettii]